MGFFALSMPVSVLTVISRKEREEERFSFTVRSARARPTALVCLEEGCAYRFETSGTVRPVNTGTYAICFDGPVEETVVIFRTK